MLEFVYDIGSWLPEPVFAKREITFQPKPNQPNKQELRKIWSESFSQTLLGVSFTDLSQASEGRYTRVGGLGG